MIVLPAFAERGVAQDLQGPHAKPLIHRVFAAGQSDGAFSLAGVIAPLADQPLAISGRTAAYPYGAVEVSGLREAIVSVFSEHEDGELDLSLVTWPEGGGCGRLHHRGTTRTGAALPAGKHPTEPGIAATQWYGADHETTVYTVGTPGVLILPESALQVDDYPVDFIIDLRGAAAFCAFLHTDAYAKLVTFQPLG